MLLMRTAPHLVAPVDESVWSSDVAVAVVVQRDTCAPSTVSASLASGSRSRNI